MRIPVDVQREYARALASGLFERFEICSAFEVFGDDVVGTTHYLFGTRGDVERQDALYLVAEWQQARRSRGVVNGYGDSLMGDVVEFFSTREEAEQFIAECLEDEPGWIDLLRVEPIDFGQQAEFSLSQAAEKRMPGKTMKPRHGQDAAVVLNAAKGGKAVVVLNRLRRPDKVADDIRQVASEMGVKVRVRVKSEEV